MKYKTIVEVICFVMFFVFCMGTIATEVLSAWVSMLFCIVGIVFTFCVFLKLP